MRGTLHRSGVGAAVLLAVFMLAADSGGQPAASAPRRGIVHAGGRAFADDQGAFLARGASLFWALWGYQHDRARLARNLATLRSWGIDYIRVLGVVGAAGDDAADSWRDRRADPSADSYDRDVAALTDWAYRDYGLRVQWTIFGGVELAPTPSIRQSIVDRFARISQGREEKIFAFEVANEGWQNGFSGETGRAELRSLAGSLKSRSRNLVALSAPESSGCEAARALYRGSAADLLTLHLPRGGMAGGAMWNTFRDTWWVGDCSGLPALASSNEPVGPESSVASSDDPGALAALAAVTYGAGIGAFVLHTGPGVRGGGAADLARSRHSNLWELPTGARIGRALAELVRRLPPDLPNWEKSDALADSGAALFQIAPRQALTGMYCFSKSPSYACVAIGIRQPLRLTAARSLSAVLTDLASGASMPTRHVLSGASIAIPASSPARLITGQFE